MSNPWSDIPLADYEGHMNAPEVWQLGALSDLFAEAVALRRPASVAILGVAGGNGLDRIDGAVTSRVVGLDVNPLYLDAVRQRYAELLGLELDCVDLAEETISIEPVQLVHAALVFEHTGVGRALENAISLVAAGGALSVVLQLPGEAGQDVGKGGFASIQKLVLHFSLIDPAGFRAAMEERDFRLVHETRRALPAGKAFWMGIFLRQ
jgi:threonine dehydrogenase-like Zn-dependent dehydrogenase